MGFMPFFTLFFNTHVMNPNNVPENKQSGIKFPKSKAFINAGLNYEIFIIPYYKKFSTNYEL